MSTQGFDPIRYKAGQRQEWDTTAPKWQDWWQQIEPALQPISERLLELADIRPGQQVLDVATGIGEPAVTAARRVGPLGHVIATDLSAEMLALGRKRVAELGLQNIDFREMDAEALDLPEKSFDVILCRLGLMFLPDPQGALERMRRLLVPGGGSSLPCGARHKRSLLRASQWRWPYENCNCRLLGQGCPACLVCPIPSI